MSPNRNVPLLTISLFRNNMLRDVFLVDDSSVFFLFLILDSLSILLNILYTVCCVEFHPTTKLSLHRYCMCRFILFSPTTLSSSFWSSKQHSTYNRQQTVNSNTSRHPLFKKNFSFIPATPDFALSVTF